MTPSTITAPTAVPATDAAAIRAIIDGMTDAWNAHDTKAMVANMTEDVQWVNVVGMWWKGKAQVLQAHEAFHQTIFKHRQLHTPETVALRAITPDVVIATIVQPSDGFTTPDGHVNPPGRDVLTEVFVRHSGRWLLTEGHNTTLVEAAQRSNPIKD